MPQLIAMIIIVVGAMIYMFQTFGGTGDKITGMAQKTSIISEINNIKSGVQFAARDKVIYHTADAGVTLNDTTVSNPQVNTLSALAKLGYFADQINSQLTTSKAGTELTTTAHLAKNIYSAISFGGNNTNAEDGNSTTNAKGDMLLSLVVPAKGKIPGIFVDLSRGGLKDNAKFLENQIANDLQGIAFVDRKADTATAGTTALGDDANSLGKIFADKISGKSSTGTDEDGMFIIYFSDFASTETVQ